MLGASLRGDADRAVERAARESFGRLVSYLAWQWRDIAAAQDALGDALVKALEVWPREGVPDSPDAWLLTVAKRQLLQMARHDKLRFDPAVTTLLAIDEAEEHIFTIPDARLKLLFVCAHPAIDEKVRIPLMLQTVLGLEVADMAHALLLSPTALAQRLVRAKQKIRSTGLRFEEPEARELPERLHHVLESIYGAFGLSVDAMDGAEARVIDLKDEALYLCSIVSQLLPDSAEAKGLLALMTFSNARRAAQVDAQGRFVPLARQDIQLWDKNAIVQADQLLWVAAQLRTPGPFQLEAAVQSAHCQRLFTGQIPWPGISSLYQQIKMFYPTEGACVAGAVALAEAGDVAAGLKQLDSMNRDTVKSFQPWWVARGHLLSMQGTTAASEADAAYQTAIGLTTQQKIRDYLESVRASLAASDEAPPV
jgi:RNA polymerase sigma-70 factor, ECF subfamily